MNILEVLVLVMVFGIVYWFWKKTNLPEYKADEAPAYDESQNRNQTWAAERAEGSMSNPRAEDLRIENVRVGAVIQLSNIGDQMDEFDLQVLARHAYRQGENTWYELECDKDGDKVWLDMNIDDEVDLAIGLKRLSLRELALSHEDLMTMDEAENGFFTHDNIEYFLEDSDGAVFYKNGDDDLAEELYYWDFASKDRQHRMGIEEWRDGSVDVTYSQAIKPGQVSVFAIEG